MGSATAGVGALLGPSAFVRSMFASPGAGVQLLRPSRPGHVVVRETTFDTTVLELPGVSAVLAARAADGERPRFRRDVPFGVVIVDGRAALIDLSAIDECGAGSLLVRDRPFVTGLEALVAMAWRSGVAMPRATGPTELSDQDRQVISLLAAGASDTKIARQLGVSQRTVERRIRALLNAFGADTRFQAGVRAARRGWI